MMGTGIVYDRSFTAGRLSKFMKWVRKNSGSNILIIPEGKLITYLED